MTPRPGKAVRGSRSGRPIMALLDLLGRRWTLRILWELQHGALNFADLRAACDAMSPSVLNQRLAELRAAGIVALRDEGGYVITAEGGQLFTSLAPLKDWAERWAQRGSATAAHAKTRRTRRPPLPSSRRA